MPELDQSRNCERAASAGLAAAFHALLLYAFAVGLGFQPVPLADDALKTFNVSAEPPPPPIVETPASPRAKDPEGAAAPPNLKARPTPVVAPRPKILLDPPPTVAAAPMPGPGAAPTAGASDRIGPGTGAGGEGSGTGSGRSGSGAGGGGGGTPARLRGGRIVDADYPRAAHDARAEGIVVARLSVGADGRVRGCAVIGSSGNSDLDETTCRLIRQRFRYEPARDAQGRPIAAITGWKQSWWLEGRR